ncbi:MAG TPA: urate hydroxylase PuuD, partial [Afifellaceae bacterium]|nr:urate hydroxylase PuuD [Afifellaceae bacterium]
MAAAVVEWIELLLRWAHVMVAILWIGTSFLFIWLDDSLRRRGSQPEGVAGDSWLVHGGGFYRAEKYRVAPDGLPQELHWFRYEAYLTWVSGFLLLAIIYYLGAEAYLIDRDKLDLAPWQAIVLSAGSLVGGW